MIKLNMIRKIKEDGFKCSHHPTPVARGTEYFNSVPAGTLVQHFKMITSAKHDGYIYISVWARVRSTRVPNIVYHEGSGLNVIKTSGINP